MNLPIWLIVICSPLILFGVVVCFLFGFSFLFLLDEYLGLFGGRIHGYSRSMDNARIPHTVIENVIVKKG